ncbi:MAG: M3 family metallopeptidase [Acidobacteriota bacterium]|nr:M3 family metallopeptidase [Acidobacteriota bacterium]
MSTDNPFLTRSPLPYQLPPFDRIDESDYLPAFEQGMVDQLDEVEAIASASDPPTFENTFVALERSGRLLERVAATFFSLSSADTTDGLDEIMGEVAPKLSAHSDRILLNADLFGRVRTLYNQRHSLDLDGEARRLIEKSYVDFVRAGALLSEADKLRMQEINAALATLQTTFAQNVLDEVNASAMVVDNRAELAGLSDDQIAAAAAAAAARDLEGKYVIPLLNTSGQPVLASLENRALREKIARVSLGRGSRGGEFDNREVITQMARLRAERAGMLGYPNHAAFSLEEQTAQTVGAVNERLASLTPPAVANARREAADLQAIAADGGTELTVAAWDWSYYTERVRADRYAFDASQLRPYFEIDAVIEQGVFFAANRLYGLTFKERTDLPVYHPDVRIWEVFESDGSPLGLFLGDYYARPSKRGGAWMNAYVSQSHLLGTSPVVANHLNIPKPPAEEPTLLTFDEVVTMFHEFGHALHGFFSEVQYPYFAGTAVPRDFVEYPSQVNEMWATWPEVLKNYAVHYETGEPMPAELLEKVLATQTFNQGFATTEYLAASLLDQAWHQLTVDEVPVAAEVEQFEAAALERAGVSLETVPPRYRSTYFSHIWSSGYSAGYYSYIWSEVLDADSVEWFKENGGLTRENGEHFRQTLLSKGGSVEALDLYRTFRGADPDVRPLLVRRGLN